MARKSLTQLLNGVTRFGRLTILGEAPDYEWNGKFYRMIACRCDCGALRDVSPSKLRKGETLSCGCYAAERAREVHLTHGMTNSGEFRSWSSMRERCFNPNATGYERYGGRGITVCKRWRDSFEAFFADMGPRPEGMSVERIHNDGPYEPNNCRWATRIEQADNTRAAHHVEIAGEMVNISELSRRTGFRQSSLRSRMSEGMSAEEAAFVPRRDNGGRHKSNNHRVVYCGRHMILAELAEQTGIEASHLRYHLGRGRSPEEAVALVRANKSRRTA